MRRRAAYFVALLLGSFFARPQPAVAQSAETVIEWNQALITTLSTPGASDPNVFFTRPVALLNVAIFDAINSFSRVYTPYLGVVDVAAGASADAAAAQAAHDVLVSMFPTQRAIYDSPASISIEPRGCRPGAVRRRGRRRRRPGNSSTACQRWMEPAAAHLHSAVTSRLLATGAATKRGGHFCALPGCRAFRDRESIPVHARGSA